MEDKVVLDINLITENKDGEIPLLEQYDLECYKGHCKKELYSRKEVELLLQKIKSESKPFNYL